MGQFSTERTQKTVYVAYDFTGSSQWLADQKTEASWQRAGHSKAVYFLDFRKQQEQSSLQRRGIGAGENADPRVISPRPSETHSEMHH